MSDEELRNHLHQFAITYNPLFKESRGLTMDAKQLNKAIEAERNKLKESNKLEAEL